jgi:hypothetical protein
VEKRRRKILLSIILIVIFAFAFKIANSFVNSFPVDNTEYERVSSITPEDKPITNADNIKGKNVVLGGPYKVGDTVVIENLAIKVDKVGWNPTAFEEEDMGYAVFKVTLYNYTYQPYEVKSEDMVLNYEGKDGKMFRQPLSASGYDNWKHIKNSFKMGKIESEKYRKGYIFFPTTEDVRNKGFVRVYINDVPIDFIY